MNFSIEKIESSLEYLDYVRRLQGEWLEPDTDQLFERFATDRHISTADRRAIESIAGYVPPHLRPQPIGVNVNHFHGCQVHIGSIGNAG